MDGKAAIKLYMHASDLGSRRAKLLMADIYMGENTGIFFFTKKKQSYLILRTECVSLQKRRCGPIPCSVVAGKSRCRGRTSCCLHIGHRKLP